ncbi:MAG: hypothetical protein P9L99_14280 [Candidatus Lernaella stagnicola]|nr:hypothetical protein [Candidatus Lernaella stagnicola]
MTLSKTLIASTLIVALCGLALMFACSSSEEGATLPRDNSEDDENPDSECITCEDNADCVAQLGEGTICKNGCCVATDCDVTCETNADCFAELGPGYVCDDSCCVDPTAPGDDDDDATDDDATDDDDDNDDDADDDDDDDDDDNDDDDNDDSVAPPTYPKNHKSSWYCYFCHDTNFLGVTPREPHNHQYSNDQCTACHKKGTWQNDPFMGGHLWALDCLKCHQDQHDKQWQEKAQCLVCHGQ